MHDEQQHEEAKRTQLRNGKETWPSLKTCCSQAGNRVPNFSPCLYQPRCLQLLITSSKKGPGNRARWKYKLFVKIEAAPGQQEKIH